jgi:hypothetical protein
MGASPAFTPKTASSSAANGDRMTGEIKSYSQGRLTLDTPAAGWISVKWNNILSIQSEKQFDFETIDGLHHYGALAPSDPPGKLLIVSGLESLAVGFFDVFDISPVHQHFWRRWDGSLNLGFNYTQSSHLVQFNLSADATYRVRKYQLVTNLSSFFSRQDDATATGAGLATY